MLLKPKNTFDWNKKSKELKEDINIVKWNISNLHKAFIPRTKSTKDSKVAQFTLLNQNRAFSAKKNFEINGLQIIVSGVL